MMSKTSPPCCRRWLLLAASLLIILFSCRNPSKELQTRINRISDSLYQVWAPDSRTALVSMSLRQSGSTWILTGESTEPGYKEDLLSELGSLGISPADSFTTLPDRSAGLETWALVNVSVANLRGKPGHSQELVTQVVMGTPLRVYKQDGGWIFVQTPEKYLAWVDEAAIQRVNEHELQQWRNSDRVIFLGDLAILRETRSEQSAAVSDVVLGSIVVLSGESGNWKLLTLPDGRSGYLRDQPLHALRPWMQEVKPDPVLFEQVGLDMLGRPYLWGGTSVKGMDCSGFVKTVFLTGGLILNRDASQQIQMGRPVDTETGFDALIKGDLLFFGRKATDDKPERITHVAMYLGDGQYIHASGRVKLNSLHPGDESYSARLVDIFVRAKRLIDLEKSDYPFSFLNHPWYN